MGALLTTLKIQLIFDSSVFNSILFAQESDDVMALVAKELGIAVPAANK